MIANIFTVFLTHTVQMKLSYTEYIKRAERSFLTHTVQMKLILRVYCFVSWYVFLTHTVQMKLGTGQEVIARRKLLLNPHGSDETTSYFLICSPAICFLTHTVQMKLQTHPQTRRRSSPFLTHTVQMKPLILFLFISREFPS